MAIERIPNSTTLAYYEVEVTLDDVEFKLTFKFNTRDDSWYTTIRSPDDVLLRAGIRIVNKWVLLRLWAEATRPDGDIVSVDQGDINTVPGLDQLGAEVLLDYLDEDELTELVASAQ